MIRTDESGPQTQRDYDAWKLAKIERGLAQSRDRLRMIPIEDVLRELAN